MNTHNFPKYSFYAPIPRNGEYIDVPLGQFSSGNILRTTCTDSAIRNKYPGRNDSTISTLLESHRACDGVEHINRLITQFNLNFTDHKILQVVKSNTPYLNDGSRACDYEVDIVRTLPSIAYPIVERDTIRIPLKNPTDNDTCLYDIDFSKLLTTYHTGKTINKNASSQLLDTPYSWARNYMLSLRQLINQQLFQLTSLDITGYMSTISVQAKNQMSSIVQTVDSLESIQGCPGVTYKSPILINAVIKRYNFDGYPAYTEKNQFGSLQRSIIQVRKSGSGGLNICHMEAIVMEETFDNWLLEPDTSNPNNPSIYSNKKYYLKQYKFIIQDSKIDNGICKVTIKPISRDDMDKQTMDASGHATGIMSDSSDISKDKSIQDSLNFIPFSIDANDVKVYTSVKLSIGTTYSGGVYVLQQIKGYVNIRPNIIEYDVFVQKKIVDQYFGTKYIKGVAAFVTATWDETKWNPMTGLFKVNGNDIPAAQLTAVPPPTVDVFIPSDVTFKKDSNGDLQIYTDCTTGCILRRAPYLYVSYNGVPGGYKTRYVADPINVTV